MNRRLPLITAAAAALALLSISPLAPAQTPPAPPQPATPPADAPTAGADRAALEEKFIKQMSGCTLVGFFSDSNHPEAPPRAEKYVITKVTKLNGDLFVFSARFQMKDGEINLPLVIPVKWAGDTPVISVTKMGIPGMGSYTARVLVYDGQYAGMWMGTGHGGNLWGKIEPLKEEPAKDAAKPADAPAEPKAK
jgi:hypothetical protein